MDRFQQAIDQRLTDSLEISKLRITYNLAIQQARRKLQQDLTYSVNGGTFKITGELISFCHTMCQMYEDAVLLDVNENPILIDDLSTFLQTICRQYATATNTYLLTVNRLKKSRRPIDVIQETSDV